MFSIFGDIKPPIENSPFFASNDGSGLFLFLNAIFKLAGTIAGIYFVIQIILAGYTYLSASGDEKKTAKAWATIWQSLIGIAIVASAFIIANTIGNWLGLEILNPTI